MLFLILCFDLKKISFQFAIVQTTRKDEEELDPEDIEFDEHYTTETRSKCKWSGRFLLIFRFFFYFFMFCWCVAEFR